MNNQIQLVLKSSTTELSLNDRELGIYLTPELDGLTGLPEIRTTSGVNAGYDGGWTSAQNYDARSITIRGVIANEDVATVEQLRRQLTTLAGQGKNEELTLDLVTQAGKAYTIQVRTIALEMSLQKVLTQQEFMLQLRADDPLIYDASETTHEALLQVAQATGGFTIDFELPLAITGSSEETVVNNEGLEQVPTVTRMYGELHNPKIINQTTNQFMQIEADLGFAEGDWTTPSEPVEGKNLTINDAPDNAPLSDFKLKGETSQNGTPTPDAPVAVQTVTGENVVKICGKNLLDMSRLQQTTINGVTFSYDPTSQTVTLNGTATARAASYFVQPISLDGSYTLSYRVVGGSISNTTSSTRLEMAKSNSDWSDAIYLRLGNSDDSLTVSRNVPYTIQNIRIDPGVVLDNYQIRVQLEKNSQATDWEAYQEQSYEVNLFGNLYDKSSAVKSAANIALTITVDVNTSYIFDTGRTWTTVHLYDSSDVRTRTLGNVSASRKVEFTTAANEVKAQLTFYVGENVDVATYDFTGVEFYKTNEVIELCGIGDDGAGGFLYQDYIYPSGDDWYLHKETAHATYGWGVHGIAANNSAGETVASANGAFQVFFGSTFAASERPNIRFSENLGKYNSTDTVSGNAAAQAMQDGTFKPRDMSGTVDRVYFRNTAYIGKTGDEVKAILLENSGGSNFWWGLSTPTDTKITNEALIEQLDAILEEAKMYNPQTNITTLYAAGNEQGTLSIIYFTDKNPDVRDELVIDSRLRTITLNGLDVYHLQAPGSEFLMLAPGENRLSLQSDITGDNGYAQVSYKQGYLSI